MQQYVHSTQQQFLARCKQDCLFRSASAASTASRPDRFQSSSDPSAHIRRLTPPCSRPVRPQSNIDASSCMPFFSLDLQPVNTGPARIQSRSRGEFGLLPDRNLPCRFTRLSRNARVSCATISLLGPRSAMEKVHDDWASMPRKS